MVMVIIEILMCSKQFNLQFSPGTSMNRVNVSLDHRWVVYKWRKTKSVVNA